MKQEQIKAKAKEYFPNDEFKQQIVIDAINWATKELQKENAELKAECDLAIEGRNVKIAELETRCNELFFQVNEKTERIAELEKENAELKEALKGKVCNCMTYLNFKDLEKKCAKAKVFIRNLKNLIEDVCDINYLSKDNTRLLVEAEQFISEVEE